MTTGELKYERTVENALRRMDQDMGILDAVADGSSRHLSKLSLVLLAGSVALAGASPFFLTAEAVELLVPAVAAVSGLGVCLWAELQGRRSVSNGVEIAAVTLQAKAEAEAVFIGAERAKAIIPLAVGAATLCAILGVLAPAFLRDVLPEVDIELATEFLLVLPLASILSAAIAGLAYRETKTLCGNAIGTGTRRFSKANAVGMTWRSATEQIEAAAAGNTGKLQDFALSTIPAPFLGNPLGSNQGGVCNLS